MRQDQRVLPGWLAILVLLALLALAVLLERPGVLARPEPWGQLETPARLAR